MITYISDNLYWYIGVPVGVVILLTLIILLFRRPIKKNPPIAIDSYLVALGGINNILGASASGSRLSLIIDNAQLIDAEGLKKLGISKTIIMSKKVILLIGEEANPIAHMIDDLLKK